MKGIGMCYWKATIIVLTIANVLEGVARLAIMCVCCC